ncbi:MAG: hypothetical protein ABEJ28_11560 [Salinigranum sp.]
MGAKRVGMDLFAIGLLLATLAAGVGGAACVAGGCLYYLRAVQLGFGLVVVGILVGGVGFLRSLLPREA